MLINTKICHFHSFINQQEHLFNRALITSYFCLVNIAKFLRTAFLQNSSRGVLKSFANFTGKYLCWSLFLKNLHAGGLQFYHKKTFFLLFLFFYITPPVTYCQDRLYLQFLSTFLDLISAMVKSI